METEADPCTVCGGSDLKLIDGFYYCIECGTQNTNVREQIIEEKALADGTFAQSTKKKIIHLKKPGIEMSGEWYRWHAFNFIMSGLADELVTLGAKPTFKMKLLWIWTKYIKKYQNKAELMMNKTSQDENNDTAFVTFMVEEDSNLDQADDGNTEENVPKKRANCIIVEGSKRDIKFLSKGLIIAMLYVGLNLDESEIQLSHLYRFIQEKHLDISNLNRFVPDDIDVKKIPQWTNFLRSKLCTHHQVRALALSLFNKLDLGTPKVPNLRKIVDIFLTELCLPNDMRQFIYSLMHFRKCDYLDIDNKIKKSLYRLPDYETTVMAYIIVAIKICFGLDCDYEFKLSDVVDKINADRDLPKSFKIGKYSDSTDRLFSFREWCNYLQYRKIMLSKFNMRMAERYCIDVDDYVYLEHMEERPKKNEELPDKISMEIIGRLPQEHNIGVIPKQMFVPTLTPMSEYTDIIIDYCQDPEVKLNLAEDFKRYSLKYACENLELIDNMNNIIKGVTHDNKTESKVILGSIVTKKSKINMVYVKNCENRNWMTTNPPTMEHVTCDSDTNDKESDHGYDSENTLKEKDDCDVVNCLTDTSISQVTDLKTGITDVNTSITDINASVSDVNTGITDVNASITDVNTSIIDVNTRITDVNTNIETSSKDENKIGIIQEEESNQNIFDDCFEDIDFKEECERNSVIDEHANEDIQVPNEVPDEDFDRRSDISDAPIFNPDTFDTNGTIKELILFACKKYKIAIPAEYKTIEARKRKERPMGDEATTQAKRSRKQMQEGKATVNELLTNYYNHLQTDFITKVQQELSLVRNTDLNRNNDETSNLQISVVERIASIESGLTNPMDQSERDSTIAPTDQENINLDVTNTESDNKIREIDETLEKSLFEDDEMKLDDLLPKKGDPKFDEEKYDISQLYIKIKEEKQFEMFDVKDDPEIDKILFKKIEECKHSAKFAELKPEPKVELKKEDRDSEDEIPLSILKKEIIQIEEMYRQEEDYERLINKVEIPEFKYWIRHYDEDFMLRSKDWHTKFDEELKENTPTSFYFVIQECASILNCTNFHLYKSLQTLEEYLMCKAKYQNDVCN